MLVPLAAAVTCAVYLATLPVKLAFALRLGPEPRLGMGLAAFEGRFAIRAARQNAKPLRLPGPKRGGTPGRRGLLRAIRVVLRGAELELSARFCLGDAALTALACGALGSLSGALAAAAGLRLSARVVPDFEATRASAEITGILTLRAGHSMGSALKSASDEALRRLSAWNDIRSKTS